MRVSSIRLSNFQSFGPIPQTVDLVDVTYVLGPNGSGKTVVLEALSRLFSPIAAQQRVRPEDFHASFTDGMLGDPASTLWIEVDIDYPEIEGDERTPAIEAFAAHMRIDADDAPPRTRIRLTATVAADGLVEESVEYVLQVDGDGEPVTTVEMPRLDRRHIEVHYLPARRDPSDHISFTAASLIGRTLRAADWTSERDALKDLSTDISTVLGGNDAVASIALGLKQQWNELYKGNFYSDPSIAFGRGELEGILRLLTVTFTPTQSEGPLPFDRLSDGQQSLLYIALVLGWQALSVRVLSGEETSLDADKLRPPVHTIIALEEPENSLAPQYLGRIISQLGAAAATGTVQSVIATHAPTVVRRVPPESIRFLRLNRRNETTVRGITLPAASDAAAKYVRGAVEAFPELYFSRLVILGEGDSELVVLPRVLAAAGILEDDASVCVVPLGGRHVHHFWRLLHELEIPHLTLLDLDSGRFGGGWGRVKTTAKELAKLDRNPFSDMMDRIPKWNATRAFPKYGGKVLSAFEKEGVFFSAPVDLDLMMMEAFPSAYGVTPTPPDPNIVAAVLGKKASNAQQLGSGVLDLFDDYHDQFDLHSKPASHLAALTDLDDATLVAGMPAVFGRLVARVRTELQGLPE